MDFSTIKEITIPEGSVKKITDGDGNIIWQKIADQPYIRLEYISFDGTNYCVSAEYNANNRAYRLDYMQTGWASNNLCYPFGIWTNTAPQNILLTRNQKSDTSTGFEVCRVSNTRFGTHPPGTYLNNRMVAEMRWGTDTTVNYRLWYHDTSTYVDNSSGTASGRSGTNTGNFFIGAINDGGGGTYSNANGLLVGRIYEVAIAGSNSFDDYAYAYVPCIRRSDGAIGFKQPHADFWPLRNKADGSIVTDVSSHMGPVVEENWDGVTYTIEPSPEAPYVPQWHTLWSGSRQIKATGSYNNSGTITGNGITLVNAQTIDTESSSIQLRITFTNYSASGSGYESSTNWVPYPKQSSPYTVTKGTASSLSNLIGVGWTTYSNPSHTRYVNSWAALKYKFTSDHQLTISTQATFYKSSSSVASGSATAQITITKIEAYY